MKDNARSTIQRRKRILELISETGEVYIHELSHLFEVSEVTIRNDLKSLEDKNLLLRARGGAIKFERFNGLDHALAEKSKVHLQEKMKIGKKAASFIQDSDTIVVDAGTTTAEVVKNLPRHTELTVITNALNIANYLIGQPTIKVIIPGGYLRQNSHSLIGPMAEKNLRSFYVNKAFIGADGIDTRIGVFSHNLEEAHLNQIMIDIAKEVILVADSSKFSKKSLALICAANHIDVLVTDDGLPSEDRLRLEESGVKVIIA